LLRRRGIFRESYEGNTLREHFGLPRPVWRRPDEPPFKEHQRASAA
jgi:hypothetical protein